jgi:hypothetical protein
LFGTPGNPEWSNARLNIPSLPLLHPMVGGYFPDSSFDPMVNESSRTLGLRPSGKLTCFRILLAKVVSAEVDHYWTHLSSSKGHHASPRFDGLIHFGLWGYVDSSLSQIFIEVAKLLEYRRFLSLLDPMAEN